MNANTSIKFKFMKPQHFFLLLFVFLSTVTLAQQYPTGLVFDETRYADMPTIAPETKSKYRDPILMPPSFSLEKYCPAPGSQGQLGACVTWASSYGARTILYAIRKGITDRATITREAFSPSYVFNQIKIDPDCINGSAYPDAFNILTRQGCDKLKHHPYTCDYGGPDPASRQRAAFYKVKETFRLNTAEYDPKFLIKRCLTSKLPVLIGMVTYRSFGRPCEGQKFWSGKQDTLMGGHAMVVVAYDDKIIDGGAVKVMNSWGAKWGTDGFIWIRWADLLANTKEYFTVVDFDAPVVEADEAPTPKPQPQADDLKTDPKNAFTFEMIMVTSDLKEMPVRLNPSATRDFGIVKAASQNTYKTIQPYATGTEFRLYLKCNQPAYLYLLGYGSMTKRVFTLYPFDRYSPYFPLPNTAIAIPSDDFNIVLDENIGKDYLCLIYSREPLEIETLRAQIEKSPHPAFSDKVKAVFGDRIATGSDLTFAPDRIGLRANLRNKSVVPVIVEMEHVK